MSRRVVITGIGALTPIGNNLNEYWSGLINGKSGAAEITRFDPALFKTKFACEVKNLDPLDFLNRKEVRKMDLFAVYAMVVADEAIKNSGIDFEKVDQNRAGVIWGSGIGGLNFLEKEITEYAQGNGTPRFNPFLIPKMIIDIVPGFISIKYGLKGINYSTVSACASSSHALTNCLDYIRMGRADIMITGGSESSVTPSSIGGFSSMRALSTRNDDPATASRPFDKERDGFVLGEGAAAFVFEEYEHAKARGATIYAEVVGAGMTADAYHITAPQPEGEGATRVMKLALEDANLSAGDIDYVNVHGTSTPLGDVAELKAIDNVFGSSLDQLNISSTKSMTGHLLGAAGAIEAVAAVMSIKHGVIPPTINHFTDDPAINPAMNLTFNTPQKKDVKAVLSNTFGFGGHNSSLIFKKLEE